MTQKLPQLMLAPTVQFAERPKLVEVVGEFDILDPDGNRIGFATDVAQSKTAKFLRFLDGSDEILERNIEVRDHDGTALFYLRRNRGWWGFTVRIEDVNGALFGSLKVGFWSRGFTFAKQHTLLDGAGNKIGVLQTRGLRRRKFEVVVEDQVRASIVQPWNGLLREGLTQADRYELTWANRPEGFDRAVLVFAMPLAVELCFKQGGGQSPVGIASDLLRLASSF